MPLVLELPARHGLPLLDLGFTNLLRCLDLDNFLTLFANLLLERKVGNLSPILFSKGCGASLQLKPEEQPTTRMGTWNFDSTSPIQ